MEEQERYKELMRKVITETENQKINTADEMIKTLVNEIRVSKLDRGLSVQAETISK